MKKSFKLNSSMIQKFKNFWFALQLLIVSVSLPVMCFVQVSRPSVNNTAQDKAVNNSAKQNQMADGQNAVNLIRLS